MTIAEIERMEALERKAWPAPWPLVADLEANDGWGNRYYDTRRPLDHEGCDVWPWHDEETMNFAYTLRNNAKELLRLARIALESPTAPPKGEENA